MFTIEELQSGIKVECLSIKIESVGSSKIVSFGEQVLPYVSNISNLFYIDNPKYWELRDDDCSNEQFAIFVNILIKDILIYKGLVSL